MYELISKGNFRDRFNSMNRKGNFSYEGLGTLFE